MKPLFLVFLMVAIPALMFCLFAAWCAMWMKKEGATKFQHNSYKNSEFDKFIISSTETFGGFVLVSFLGSLVITAVLFVILAFALVI